MATRVLTLVNIRDPLRNPRLGIEPSTDPPARARLPRAGRGHGGPQVSPAPDAVEGSRAPGYVRRTPQTGQCRNSSTRPGPLTRPRCCTEQSASSSALYSLLQARSASGLLARRPHREQNLWPRWRPSPHPQTPAGFAASRSTLAISVDVRSRRRGLGHPRVFDDRAPRRTVRFTGTLRAWRHHQDVGRIGGDARRGGMRLAHHQARPGRCRTGMACSESACACAPGPAGGRPI
jgi:hypothetical protein